MAEPSVTLVVDDDLLRSRATVFFRLALALPHLIVLWLAGIVAAPLAVVQWAITLVRGRPQRRIAAMHGAIVRYGVHVVSYLTMAAAPWPPFLGRGAYPVDVRIEIQERQGRWGVAFRALLALPAMLLTATIAGNAPSAGRQGAVGAPLLAIVAVLGWFTCLARARMPRGMRDLAAWGIGYGAQTYAYLFMLTASYPDADPQRRPVPPGPEHPVAMEVVGDDLRRTRLTVLFRLLLAVPHLIWLMLWGVVATLATIAGWLSALALGRLPDALHRFLAAYLRYATHVNGFLLLATNPFPGFTGAPEANPLRLHLAAPERQPRWSVLVRVPLALPALLLAAGLSGVSGLCTFYAWWFALVTGRIPTGLRNPIAYSLRYEAQLWAYLGLLTPRYPYSGYGPTGY
jgi:hypothetical protein